MRKTLKCIAWLLNLVLASTPVVLLLFVLGISSLLTIVFSPLLAFVRANEYKLVYKPSESWWEIYKTGLVVLCTELLPIRVYAEKLLDV